MTARKAGRNHVPGGEEPRNLYLRDVKLVLSVDGTSETQTSRDLQATESLSQCEENHHNFVDIALTLWH
jgi:hypothetical protein